MPVCRWQSTCQHAGRADLCAARVLYVFDVDYFGEKDQAAACAHVQANDSILGVMKCARG